MNIDKQLYNERFDDAKQDSVVRVPPIEDKKEGVGSRQHITHETAYSLKELKTMMTRKGGIAFTSQPYKVISCLLGVSNNGARLIYTIEVHHENGETEIQTVTSVL